MRAAETLRGPHAGLSGAHPVEALGGSGVPARVGDRVVNWPADDAHVEKHRHAECFGGRVRGQVIRVVVVAGHTDQLQTTVAHRVQPADLASSTTSGR